MKFYMLPVFLLMSVCSLAQEAALTNDLAKRVIKQENNSPSYQLDPVQFNKMIDQARQDDYMRIKPGGDEETILKHLDADYSMRYSLSSYSMIHEDNWMTPVQGKYVDSLAYSKTDPNNEALFKGSAVYRQWISQYLRKMYKTKYKSDTSFNYLKLNATIYSKGGSVIMVEAMPISVVVGEIQNPFIRDYECYMYTSVDFELVKKNSVLAEKIFRNFNVAVTNTIYKNQVQELYDNYKRINIAGAPAPDFTYEGVDGKPITLSNLRGKYVYIDIWSTTCPHCIEQFPYLAKIEKGYKDKNIRFVSLSLDHSSRKNIWRKYVADHNLTGYQVIANKDFHSDFIEKINIVSIPRFILIDPAGNVVDGDAKRPSDPALKKQLKELLN